mmetsp:Transcript_19463/g.32725  ORF Transcript_19463/g.32725 Transcript_19463/m.32725 type:complete len:204 (-) Transcript_19463:532-1143(-)
MRYICTIQAHYMHYICTIQAEYIANICTTCAVYMHHICTIYALHMHYTGSLYALYGLRTSTRGSCEHLFGKRVVPRALVLVGKQSRLALEHVQPPLLYRIPGLGRGERFEVFGRRFETTRAARLERFPRLLVEEEALHSVHHVRVEEQPLLSGQIPIQFQSLINTPIGAHVQALHWKRNQASKLPRLLWATDADNHEADTARI